MKDTTQGMSVSDYIEIIEDAGFEKVYETTFRSTNFSHEDKFFVYARQDGLLLAFDTFRDQMNGRAALFYQLRLSDPETNLPHSAGSLVDDDTWCGSIQARDELLASIDMLKQEGELLCEWEHAMYLSLMHSEDLRSNRSLTEINSLRIAAMPDWVQSMLGPNAPQAIAAHTV